MKEFNFLDLLIDKTESVKSAMKMLDIVASKILFVCDEEHHLVGSLTDGDVRRFILSNGALDSEVECACNKKSYRLYEGYKKEKVIEDMESKGIVFAPILNKKDIIIDILSYSLISKKIIKKVYQKIHMPVVIMAGGKGTRMEPFTNVLPKPLIPIGDKTMLEYIIDEYRHYEIENFFLTINYKGNLIKAYLNGESRDYSITYLEESDFFGTAGSLKLLEDVPETFIVSNCDIIVKADFNDVIKFHKKNKSDLTILSSIQHHAIPYGVIEFEEGGRVKEIKEKPEFSIPINTGVYIVNKAAWEYIPENKFFHMTHLIEALIKDDRIVMTYPVNESDYIDIGQWEEYKHSIKKMQ